MFYGINKIYSLFGSNCRRVFERAHRVGGNFDIKNCFTEDYVISCILYIICISKNREILFIFLYVCKYVHRYLFLFFSSLLLLKNVF